MRAFASVASLLLASAVTSGVALTAEQSSAARARADLRVTSVANPPRTAEHGTAFRVRARVANKGKRTTGRRTVVRILLSRNRSLGRTDQVLKKVRIRKLARGKAVRVKVRVKVRARVPVGRYRVLVCADATKKVKESREGNNCRASKRRIRVKQPTAPPASGTFPKPASPIDVSYTTEAPNAVTRHVSGGFDQTVTATAEDGTTYALTVPVGALLSPVDITVTPVAEVEGFPLADLVGAVEIQPHGLRLFRPARLVVTPPAGTTVSKPEGFLFAQRGLDFHRYPMTRSGDGSITMHLSHFSTPGVGTGTQAQLDRVDFNPPSDVEAQFEGAAAEAMQEGRSVEVVIDAYVEDVIKPLLEKAKTNDTFAQDAVTDTFALERQLQLLGLDGLDQELLDAVMEVLRNALEQASVRCIEDHRLNEVLRLLSMARTWQLLGFEDDGVNIAELAFNCARFEVRFTATATEKDHWPLAGHTWGEDLSGRWAVASTITLEADATGDVFGSSALEHTDFDYLMVQEHRGSPEYCPTWTRTTEGTGTTPGVSSARLRLDLNQYAPPRSGVPGVIPEQRLVFSSFGTFLDHSVPWVHDPATEQYHAEGGCLEAEPQDFEGSRWLEILNFVHARAGRTMPSPLAAGDRVQMDLGHLVLEFAAIDQSGATFTDQSWSDRWDSTCEGECDNHRTAVTRVVLEHAPVR